MVTIPEKSVKAEDITRLDKNTADLGIPPQLLMECAGLQATNKIIELYNLTPTNSVMIFAGTGNNGGDGMVIARHLATRGICVEFILCGLPMKIRTAETRLNWDILQNLPLNISILILTDSTDLQKITTKINNVKNLALIVDAMLGTGVKGEIREPISSTIDFINDLPYPVVAIDVNTGCDPNTGEIRHKAVKMDHRITFHRDKIGLENLDKSWVAPIGTPIEAHLFVGAGDLHAILPKRRLDTHKGLVADLLEATINRPDEIPEFMSTERRPFPSILKARPCPPSLS